MSFQDISIQEFEEKKQSKIVIIDIRDQESYNKESIPNAVNYNSEDIMKLIQEPDLEKSVDIIIYCYHGNSSRKVAAFLSENGFNNVCSLIGGFSAWKNN